MNLKTFLHKQDRAEFATKVGTTKNYIDQLCIRQRRPSPELAQKIEEATNKQVTCLELLYPDQHQTAQA